jgi:hypothetical protein
MLRFMMLVPVVAILSGCWWDSAPEIYKVELRYQEENGETRSRSFVCDFRGQSGRRSCDQEINWSNEHFTILANPANPKHDKIEEIIASQGMRHAFNKLTAEFLHFNLSAHARKEDRYQMRLSLGRLWAPEEEPTATNDAGDPVFIVTDSELRNGFSQNYVPAHDDMNAAFTKSFQWRVDIPLLTHLRKGVKEDDDVFLVQATKPITSATVSVTWTPIDEEDITRTDKVS